jgi:autotransporter-associated beta strand protein
MKPKPTLRNFLALAGSSLLAISSTHAGQIWDGGSLVDSNITTPENWDGDIVANFGSAISFGGNVRNAVTNDRAIAATIAGINFTNNGSADNTNGFTLTGNSITLGGNIGASNVTTGPAITNTIDLDIILNANRAISFGNNHNLIISGDISETGTGRNLVMTGSGITTLTGTNTFTGTVGVQRGTLEISSISDFGVASSVGAGNSGNIAIGSANNTATIRYTGGAQSTNRTITIGNAANTQTGGARIINDGTGALTFNAATFNSGNGNLNPLNRALTLGGTNGGSITGIIQDSSAANTNSVVKEGDGTWTLGGDNSYTGGTSVNGGTLLINGSTSSTGLVTVGTSGTLGGNGTVGAATTVNGNLRPGASPGLLSFSNSLALTASSTTTFEIDGTNRGSQYDGVNVGTTLGLGGALVFDIGAALSSNTFNLFDVIGATSGDFTSVSLTGFYGAESLTNNLGVWTASTNAGNEVWTFTQSTGDLNLSVIPEPSAALLGGLGLLALLRRRR